MAEDTYTPDILKDIIQANKLINKSVLIRAQNKDYSGFIDAIDPVSGSVILASIKDNTIKIHLIFEQAIEFIKIAESPGQILYNIPIEKEINTDDVESKKSRVHNWLLRNLLPVKDVENVLHVHDGSLHIKAPYGIDDCFSSNTIILSRVQHLIQNIPKDFS